MHCTNIMLCLFAKIETKLTWIMDEIGDVVYWLDIVDCSPMINKHLGLLVLIICETKTIFHRLFCYATLVGMFVIFMGVRQWIDSSKSNDMKRLFEVCMNQHALHRSSSRVLLKCWGRFDHFSKGECLEEMAPNKKRHQIQKGKKLEGKNQNKKYNSITQN